MLIWTLDKFINPGHAASVYEKFYLLSGWGKEMMFAVGAVELLILLGFVLGIQKRLTYGAVMLLHGVSTLSSYQQYLAPFEGPNLLFFAAWPMLAASVVLYLLRDLDVTCTISR